MIVHDLVQGSPQWLAYRATHFNASDAPAMMGCSPYKTRAQLLRELHTGVVPEVDTATHTRFANGHRAEALARPLAEELLGAELYPVVGSEGRLSASFDGLTLDELICLEHKAWNNDLRAAFASMRDTESDDAGRELPIHHRIQMEQQLLVSGAERVLFMASAWDAEGGLIEEHHCWYLPDPELRRQIIDGWAQFERDLQAYELPPSDAEPAPVGKAPETLPALRIEVTGAVTASNLAEFKAAALAAIRSVNRTLRTDQDFADADKAVKWCSEVESRLKAAKERALSQTADIDALFRALDEIGAEARAVRLDIDKLVSRRKTEVKEEAVASARKALDQHIAALNAEITPMRVPQPVADFAGAIKGLKSFSSMQDKLDQTLAVAKIAADADARAIRGNVAAFQQQAAGFEFLFADLGQIVHKAADDFAAVVQARIARHREAEARREAERQAAEAARIAAAEQRAREEEARRIEQQRRTEEAARIATEATARAAQAAPAAGNAQAAAPAPTAAAPAIAGTAPAAATGAAGCDEPADGHRAVRLIRADSVAPANEDPATLNLGAICARLGFTVSAQFVQEALHVAPARTEKASKLYTERQYQLICRQLVAHVGAMADLHAEGAAA